MRGQGAYLISPGSEMPPGVTSDPEAVSAVIFAVCMGGVLRVRVQVLVLVLQAAQGRDARVQRRCCEMLGCKGEDGSPWSCWGLGGASSVARRDRIKKQEGRRVSFADGLGFGMDGMAGIFDGLTR